MGDRTIDRADDLRAAVAHVRAANCRAATLIVPRRLGPGEAAAWRGEPRIRCVMAPGPLPDATDDRLIPMPDGGLAGALGGAEGVPVLVARWPMLRLTTVLALVGRGRLSLVCFRAPAYVRLSVGAILLWFIADCALALSAARGGIWLQRLYQRLSG